MMTARRGAGSVRASQLAPGEPNVSSPTAPIDRQPHALRQRRARAPAATKAASGPLASTAPRPCRTPSSMRTGISPGTVSMWPSSRSRAGPVSACTDRVACAVDGRGVSKVGHRGTQTLDGTGLAARHTGDADEPGQQLDRRSSVLGERVEIVMSFPSVVSELLQREGRDAARDVDPRIGQRAEVHEVATPRTTGPLSELARP